MSSVRTTFRLITVDRSHVNARKELTKVTFGAKEDEDEDLFIIGAKFTVATTNDAIAAVFQKVRTGEDFQVTFEPMSEVSEVPLQTPGQSVSASGSSHISGVSQSIRHS